MSGNTVARLHPTTLAPGRAARELGLKRSEFDLGVHLGRIRTTPDEGGGGRRVARAEIDRLRAEPGFPETLRRRVQAVGTGEGAAVLEVPPTRFTRLARVGLVVPVKFYLNRYRAVVWLYLAEELRQFAADRTNAFLLTGRTPEVLRSQLAAGVDLRPRNWRGRHLGFLLRQTDDPWQRAGVLAAFLGPPHVAEIVDDPYERSHLNRFRPVPPAYGAPGSPAAQLIEKIMTAQDRDEIDWLSSDLANTLAEARTGQPAPRPLPKPARQGPSPRYGRPDAPDTRDRSYAYGGSDGSVASDEPSPSTRGLFGWLRRRNG
ncbi:hypothetical protein QF032_001200 [Streptomyces achromogenes]|uniref:Uncharacterized protein n=1 Tax=Streptomyces achromogenes TaxID=67255 RepID=A0ABU0PUZ1_STRAH|nr:DUF6397 family protein [Streptomyces achromogenes]MDQ0682209.1 hypothetical protein [Streptomyces achromogenes]MDQ0829356.1 hypothetical protein [Streptomyces achromogenes]